MNVVTTGMEAKRVAALLRDARAALRKVDTLAATALAVEDPSLGAISEARAAVERVVRQLERRHATVARQKRVP